MKYDEVKDAEIKVGDRVRAFDVRRIYVPWQGEGHVYEGTVKFITGDIVSLTRYEDILDSVAHIRACVKLVEAKPKKGFINPKWIVSENPGHFIKVCEVLE